MLPLLSRYTSTFMFFHFSQLVLFISIPLHTLARPGSKYVSVGVEALANEVANFYPATFTGCVPFQDPDAGETSRLCVCSDFSTTIPSQAKYSSVGGCKPTMTQDKPMENKATPTKKVNPITTTEMVTMSNQAVNEYYGTMPTSANFDAAGIAVTTMIRLSTSSLYSGKKMNIVQPSTTSANVGTLTGMPLYTAVSNGLMAMCTEDGGGRDSPAKKCEGAAPTIKNIIYTNDEGDWWGSGELNLEVAAVSYTDRESLHAMVASIAAALNSTSMSSDNQWKPENATSSGYGFYSGNMLDDGQEPPAHIANIPGWIEAIYTQDTAEAHDWPEQHLIVNLVDSYGALGAFTCADGALITDSLAALSLIPGLDFLAWMAAPALGLSATCAAEEHAADKE